MPSSLAQTALLAAAAALLLAGRAAAWPGYPGTCTATASAVGSMASSTQPNTYTFELPAGGYIPGETYDVVFDSPDVSIVRGLLLYASEGGASAAKHGSFAAVANTQVICGGLGHANANDKALPLTVQWTAPSTDEGELTFHGVGVPTSTTWSIATPAALAVSTTPPALSAVAVGTVRSASFDVSAASDVKATVACVALEGAAPAEPTAAQVLAGQDASGAAAAAAASTDAITRAASLRLAGLEAESTYSVRCAAQAVAGHPSAVGQPAGTVTTAEFVPNDPPVIASLAAAATADAVTVSGTADEAVLLHCVLAAEGAARPADGEAVFDGVAVDEADADDSFEFAFAGLEPATDYFVDCAVRDVGEPPEFVLYSPRLNVTTEAAAAPATLPAVEAAQLPNKATLGGGLTVHWQHNATLGLVRYGVTGSSAGFAALGFPSSSGRMAPSIAWIFDSDDSLGEFKITAKSGSAITPLAASELSDVMVSRSGDAFSFAATRAVTTEEGGTIFAAGATQEFIYARGSGALAYHGSSGRGSARVDVGTGEATSVTLSDKYFKAHGVCMALAWGLLLPVGAIFGKFGKALVGDPAWFTAHRAAQSVGVLLSVVGGFMAYEAVEDRGSEHSRIAHAKFGAFLIIGGVVQALGGALRARKGGQYRVAWEWFHHVLGWVLVVGAMFNIYSGLDNYPGGASSAFNVVWAIAVSAYLATFVLLFFRARAAAKAQRDTEAKSTELGATGGSSSAADNAAGTA